MVYRVVDKLNICDEMRNRLLWIFMVILPQILVESLPVNSPYDKNKDHTNHEDPQPHHLQRYDGDESSNEKVISVRITSSVAVGRRKGKHKNRADDNQQNSKEFPLSSLLLDNIEPKNEGDQAHDGNREIKNKIINKYLEVENDEPPKTTGYSPTESILTTQVSETEVATGNNQYTNSPTWTVEDTSILNGANIDYLRQLNAKKESKSNQKSTHPYELNLHNQTNDTDDTEEDDDSVAETSIKSVVEIAHEDVPLARSISRPHSEINYIRGLDRPIRHHISSPRLTTVSFNIVHDNVRDRVSIQNENLQKKHPHVFNEPAKVYSQPAKVYGEPAKIYGEPAKIYGEPAKVYGEPSKVYGEPAKIYGEPAKFYSKPASLNLPNDSAPNTLVSPAVPQPSWIQSSLPDVKIPISTTPSVFDNPDNNREHDEHSSKKNFDVDEKAHPLSHDSINGDQVTNPENCRQENCKVGYVVEGRQYKKYRVEEKTSDGFIVGEYGVVRNEDGALRGVRYTADGEASPRLIYDALMKFLQL